MVKGLHETLMDRFLWLLCQLQNSPSSGFIIQTLEVADWMIKNGFWILQVISVEKLVLLIYCLILSWTEVNTQSYDMWLRHSSQCSPGLPLGCLFSHSSEPHPQSYNPSTGLGKGRGSRGGFAPPVGQGFPLSKSSLALSYSFFNFQLKRCLWAFFRFSNRPCSLLSALTKCCMYFHHSSYYTVW